MEKINKYLSNLKKSDQLRFEGNPTTGKIKIPLTKNRSQLVTIAKKDGFYTLSSKVVDFKSLTEFKIRKEDIAVMMWLRNRKVDTVNFTFDGSDNVIGVIEVPSSYLDQEELKYYVRQLSAECDNFEYTITGKDVQ
jgi:hypothetical protein